MRGGLEIETQISHNKWVSQRSSAVVCMSAWYSNSQMELETVGHFLSFQETKLSLRKIEYPEVERQVLGQPTQSTSK